MLRKMTECGARLASLLASKGMTKKELAEKLDISAASLYNKMYGLQAFTQEEIMKIKVIFNLSPEELDYIFFIVSV